VHQGSNEYKEDAKSFCQEKEVCILPREVDAGQKKFAAEFILLAEATKYFVVPPGTAKSILIK